MDNVRVDPLADPVGRMVTPMRDATVVSSNQQNPLDSDKSRRIHQWLLGCVQYEKRRQSPNRLDMALDSDYYDSIQFTEEDLQELLDRGQAPLVYNLVKRTADWVIGTEKRTRFDFKVLGRTKDDVEPARVKTDAMKYFDDVNRTAFHRSQAFRECVISGVGWLEDGIRGDTDEEPIYSGNESWWYTLHDSHAMQLDHTDARYHFRWRYVDLDVALAMFPNREQFINNDVQNGSVIDERMMDDFYLGNRVMGEDYLAGQYHRRLGWSGQGFVDSSRDRVKLYEGWFKQPIREQTMQAKKLPRLHGASYDSKNTDMNHALVMGDASLVERMNMRVFYCIFTESGVLAAGRSPYRHNQFPFTPIWCYRRGRDNAPYGIIRGIRDPQDGFNRRMSKAIFALTAYRVDAESNAIDEKTQSWEDIRIEAGRPDAMIIRKPGTKLEVSQDRSLGEEHLKIAQTEGSLILDASGVTADNLGLESNAQSGKAIIAKQAEGSAVTAEVFDNLRLAGQIQGEKRLSLIEQFVSEEKVMRITDSRGKPSWKKVNEVTQDPQTGEVRVLNDLTATKADFVIDQQDWHATTRQAAVEALLDVLGKAGNLDPKIALRILRMAADMSDWPNKDDIVKELDQLTGYQDPAAALTAEEQAEQQQAEQQQAQAQQKQQAMQDAQFKADIDKKTADAEKQRADAQRLLAEADAKRLEVEQKRQAGVANPVMEQQLNDQRAQHQAQLEAANQKLEELRGQVQQHDNERHRINTDAATKVQVARIQNQPQPTDPTQQETLADLAQDVQALSDAMREFKSQDLAQLMAAVAEIQKHVQQQPKGTA
jgi:hypothetical protein